MLYTGRWKPKRAEYIAVLADINILSHDYVYGIIIDVVSIYINSKNMLRKGFYIKLAHVVLFCCCIVHVLIAVVADGGGIEKFCLILFESCSNEAANNVNKVAAAANIALMSRRWTSCADLPVERMSDPPPAYLHNDV